MISFIKEFRNQNPTAFQWCMLVVVVIHPASSGALSRLPQSKAFLLPFTISRGFWGPILLKWIPGGVSCAVIVTIKPKKAILIHRQKASYVNARNEFAVWVDQVFLVKGKYFSLLILFSTPVSLSVTLLLFPKSGPRQVRGHLHTYI